MKKLLLSTAVLALTAACQPAEAPDETTQTETETAAMTGSADIGTWGFDLEGMDAAIIAGDDLYRYANGTWLDNTVIPSDRSNYGMFTALAIEAEEQVQDIILELAAQDAADGTIEQKVGDLYGSWMDTSTIDQLGLARVEIARWRSPPSRDQSVFRRIYRDTVKPRVKSAIASEQMQCPVSLNKRFLGYIFYFLMIFDESSHQRRNAILVAKHEKVKGIFIARSYSIY